MLNQSKALQLTDCRLAAKWRGCETALRMLIKSTRPNGHDPNAYLRDMFTCLPTQKTSARVELLPQDGERSAHVAARGLLPELHRAARATRRTG